VKRTRGGWLAAVLALALVLPSRMAAEPVEIGRPVPEFEATTLQGEAVSLRAATQRNKAVVLLFLSTVCPYVNRFADHLRELAETFGPKGVLFVGIYSNHWESREEAVEHGREHGFTFPLIGDERHRIASLLGATRTPETFVVDSAGRLRYRGRILSKEESPELRRAIEAVVEDRPVRIPVTTAFGCAIDRE
jgi:cytochrome c biogenesis protein CcmG/thiol:disulfide interchange protein DsbE